MQRIIQNNKKYILFIFGLILIGLVSGFIYYHFLSNDTQIRIINTLNSIKLFNCNFIVKHLVIMSLILVLSFFVIGAPLSLVFLFYESLSVGFLINIFFVSFGLKGLIYSLLFILFNKAICFILIICFTKKTINISRLIIGIFIYKKTELFDKIIINFRNSLYIILFALFFNCIVYFLSPHVFSYLSFLLK